MTKLMRITMPCKGPGPFALFFIALVFTFFANTGAISEISSANAMIPTQNDQKILPEGAQAVSSDEFTQDKDVSQSIESRFFTYRPIYYIDALQHNEESADAMVNISFKYKLITDQELYFGYSQLMFWDKTKDSSPFKDINYNPEMFYRWSIAGDFIRSVDLGIFEHRSNGRDGEDSRSWDRQYVQLNTAYKKLLWFKLKREIKWELKYFNLVEGGLSDNKDIGNYIGNWVSRITMNDYMDFGILKKTEIYCEFYAGGATKLDLTQGGVEYGYIFTAEFFGVSPRIYIQAFNGYGHSLLNYNKIENAIRLGLIIN